MGLDTKKIYQSLLLGTNMGMMATFTVTYHLEQCGHPKVQWQEQYRILLLLHVVSELVYTYTDIPRLGHCWWYENCGPSSISNHQTLKDVCLIHKTHLILSANAEIPSQKIVLSLCKTLNSIG